MLLDINRNAKDRDLTHASTHAGMAHFAGTGPVGKTCGGCEHYRGSPTSRTAMLCGKAIEMGSKSRTGIPANAMACKYFEQAKRTP